MEFVLLEDGFRLKSHSEDLITHTKENPFLYVGYGEETIEMYRGNFKIEDYMIERYPLKNREKRRDILRQKKTEVNIWLILANFIVELWLN